MALAVAGGLLAALSDTSAPEPRASAVSSTTSPTGSEPAATEPVAGEGDLTVSARSTCGPNGGPYVRVSVIPADGSDLTAQLVVDGEVVATGQGPASQLGIALFRVKGWEDPSDPGGVRGRVVVRDGDEDGPVLGIDEMVTSRGEIGCR